MVVFWQQWTRSRGPASRLFDITSLAFYQWLINRLPALHGERLFLFCENGAVAFDALTVRPFL